EQLTVYWDGSSLIFEGKPFNQYFQHNLIEKTIEFYLLDEEKNKIYDIVGKQSILIGNDPFADITIDELRADFVLKSVRNSNSYTLHVQKGKIYHNYTLVTGEVEVNPGDHLFADGAQLIV